MGYTIGSRSKGMKGNGAWSLYCKNKTERNRYTFTIDCEGNCYYMVEGNRITESEFNQMFPIGLIDRSDGKERIDSRQRIY